MMMSPHGHKDAVFVHGIFSYFASCLRDGDARALRAIGIRPDQTQRILDLTTADLMRLAGMGAHCLNIQVDADALDDLFAMLDQDVDRQGLIHDCIRHDAPRAMMTELFGISNRHYTRLRTLFQVPPAVGRPRQPTAEESHEIYDQWQASGGRMDPRTLLAIARELNLSLRLVWEEVTAHVETPPPNGRTLAGTVPASAG